ncbi:MAG TPA: class I SAM-dependent methyltransferase [Candidatus Nanoarchaeia archaeon]|nr:class I SAM-dependent methyltransferase [Candidatus Nanoarchaeia archaeon]
MKKQALYKELAKYYDLIYSSKDYQREAETVKSIVSKYKKSKGKKLLEVACGTAGHLKHLKSDFDCTGIDLNEEMLKIAKKNTKGVKFLKEDMASFNLNKKFDIIICLFSSIGYVKSYGNLKKTISNFYRHLENGGVLIVEPWLKRSDFKVGTPHMATYQSENLKIARVDMSKIRGNVSVMDMRYLIAEKGKEIKQFSDRHEMGLFEIDKTTSIMKKAGFKVRFLKDSLMEERGLFIATK